MNKQEPSQIASHFDLSECDREPIHVPGSIQPFGVMLAMQSGTRRISQVTSNCEAIFGIRPEAVLGQKLQDLLTQDVSEQIFSVLDEGSWKEVNPIRHTIAREGRKLLINLIVHRHDGLDIVEVEVVDPEHESLAQKSHQLVRGALMRLQTSLSSDDLWKSVVNEVHRITGFNRVMVYKFDRDNHGSVIAERKEAHQQSYLGLHYPSSDIPEQARKLYTLNWTRYIPDVRYTPVPLIPIIDEGHRTLTDLTYSVLRSVSPVHCEYLINMNVAASMSISIIRHDRLWGLIACHHETAKYLPYELRSACELMGQMLSIRIAAIEDTEDNVYKAKTNVRQAQFLSDLPRSKNAAVALISRAPNLMDFIPAQGGAVIYGEKVFTMGKTPDEQVILQIIKATLTRMEAPIFVSDRLQDRVPFTSGMIDTASGALLLTVSKAHQFYVAWFRAEQPSVIQWAGEPTKPVEMTDGKARLSPRRSFAVWKEEVRGKSEAWARAEIEAAAELRATLMSLLLANPEVMPGA